VSKPAAVSPSVETVLTRVALFAGLGRVELARLAAHLEPIDLAAGDDVIRQGEVGDSLYVVERGVFAVLLRTSATAETRVGTMETGDAFGEMALLTDEPRSATVRAETAGRVLKLGRERFLELLRREPTAFLAVATTLSRRLAAGNVSQLESEEYLGATLAHALEQLPAARRGPVVDACVLDELSDDALRALFGAAADGVRADLARIGIRTDAPSGAGLRSLRQRLLGTETTDGFHVRAARVIERLVAGRAWEHALAIAARDAARTELAPLLGQALRADPPLATGAAERWAARLTDDEALHDAELAIARARALAARGARPAAESLLRRAVGVAVAAGDEATVRRLSEVLARGGDDTDGARDAQGSRDERGGRAAARGAASADRQRRRAIVFLIVSGALVVGAALPGTPPATAFVALLGAAIVMMTSRLIPSFAAGLGLIAGWLVLGVAKPTEALAGFASKEWLFVLAIYGLAAATARSGVLFRVGLLLVRHLPRRLIGQAAVLLATGLVLTPLLPSSTARASLVSPLTLAVAEALRLPERGRSAAVLGLGAWVGAGPLMFAFLNGSGTCLLAWGLLPESARGGLTWTTWLVAAAPLALFVCAGALVLLIVMFRPDRVVQASHERVALQIAVLGPPSRREIAMIAILCLTVAGWIVAPYLRLDLATVAVLGLLLAVASGVFDVRAFQGLDWDFLLFIGVVLSIGKLAVALRLDRAAAAAIGGLFQSWTPGPIVFVLAVAMLSVLARLLIEQDLTVVLGTLTLVPVAPALGTHPWLVAIALLATSVAWILPTQTPSYLVAQAASEHRLFSHAQAQRFGIAWTLLILLGLALCVPYWRLLGLA
jgi:CRP-like cAMP-binding protein/di/tricarboxylate transporter